MNNSIFNSPFEMSLRIILLLSSASKQKFTEERIIALDFISCYAADFGFPYGNLHGENHYRYGEIISRKLLVREAIKKLVIEGMTDVAVDRGYYYSISESGKKYASKLKSEYARAYKESAKAVTKYYKNHTDESILAVIQSNSINGKRG